MHCTNIEFGVGSWIFLVGLVTKRDTDTQKETHTGTERDDGGISAETDLSPQSIAAMKRACDWDI